MTDLEMLKTQAAAASLLYFILEYFKKSPSTYMQWIGDHTPQINRWVSVAYAALISWGFTWTVSGSLATGGYIQIGYPSLDVFLSTAVTFITQLGLQHGAYKTFTLGRTKLNGNDQKTTEVSLSSNG